MLMRGYGGGKETHLAIQRIGLARVLVPERQVVHLTAPPIHLGIGEVTLHRAANSKTRASTLPIMRRRTSWGSRDGHGPCV